MAGGTRVAVGMGLSGKGRSAKVGATATHLDSGRLGTETTSSHGTLETFRPDCEYGILV